MDRTSINELLMEYEPTTDSARIPYNQKMLRNFQRPHEDAYQHEAEQQDDEVRQDQPERIGEF